MRFREVVSGRRGRAESERVYDARRTIRLVFDECAASTRAFILPKESTNLGTAARESGPETRDRRKRSDDDVITLSATVTTANGSTVINYSAKERGDSTTGDPFRDRQVTGHLDRLDHLDRGRDYDEKRCIARRKRIR